MSNRWRLFSIGLLVVAMLEFGLLIREGGTALSKATATGPVARDDGFEAFEGINFAREFSERFQTFESRTFRSTQTATAFLLEDEARAVRLREIDRLAEKIERRDVTQKARLVTLLKLPFDIVGDKFRADLDVELTESSGATAAVSHFTTRLEFTIARALRSEQNPWGFHVLNLTQAVVQPAEAEAALLPAPTFALRPKIATLIRFPCSIENVELPKSTSIRVKLTTLDISELQLKTETPLTSPQTVRAVCRDRVFTMQIEPERTVAGAASVGAGAASVDASASTTASEPLVVLKSLTLQNSTVASSVPKKKKHRKTDVEKSIEDQLGFVVEEE